MQISLRTLDTYTRKHTAYNTFREFTHAVGGPALDGRGGYTPTLRRADSEQAALGAELEAMEFRVFWR